MDNFSRAWFTFIGNTEEMDEALCYIRGFVEEAVLSHSKICLEIHIERGLPKDIQHPARNSDECTSSMSP